MTIVEFYDDDMINNVISSLKFNNDKVLYVIEKSKENDVKLDTIKRFFEVIKKNIIIETIVIDSDNDIQLKHNIENIIHILQEKDDKIMININGGKRKIILSIGMLIEQYDIPVFSIDIYKDMVHWHYYGKSDSITVDQNEVWLSVRENIVLYGGDILDYISTENSIKWKLNEDFVNDINNMWNIYVKNCNRWNRDIGNMEHFYNKELGLLIGTPNDTMNRLLDLGILVKEKRNMYAFKNSQMKEFLMKVGNLLELYVYMAARNLVDRRGESYFDDVRVSVTIDWDGIYHDAKDNIKDTRNEIDVMMMRKNIPIFVSCKSGDVSTDELYKIAIVANKFGGRYAKKILIISDFCKEGVSYNYFMQRAADMDIKVIGDAHKYSGKEFEKILMRSVDKMCK